MEDLLTLQEVSATLRLTDQGVINLIKRGDLKGGKIGGVWRVKPGDLDDYVNRSLSMSDLSQSSNSE